MRRLIISVGFIGYLIGAILTVQADPTPHPYSTLDRLGAVAVLPVHARPDAPAIRVLMRARKGSRAPLEIYAGFVLTDASGRPTPAAEAVLRDGAALDFAHG